MFATQISNEKKDLLLHFQESILFSRFHPSVHERISSLLKNRPQPAASTSGDGDDRRDVDASVRDVQRHGPVEERRRRHRR